MTQAYSIEPIEHQLQALGLPFAPHFARALVALLSGRKISLHQVTHLMPGNQNPEANRQQLRRCLDHEMTTPEAWTRAIAALLPKGKWVLALDRTEWKRGTSTINLLVLAVVVHGCAVPLLWSTLANPGASDTQERKNLLGRFVALLGKERVRFVTADREFIGREWIGWLLEQGLAFRIRIKAGEWLGHADPAKGQKRGSDWFALQACRCKPRPMTLWGLRVYVGGKYLRGGEYLIVIGSEKGDLLCEYRLRWKVETLFQALKGRGFDLESCRLFQERRLSSWFGLLALALCWCLKVGSLLDGSTPLPLKTHGRRAVSVFLRGLRELQALVSRLAGRPCHARFYRVTQELCPQELCPA
jgi:hypothetical protein